MKLHLFTLVLFAGLLSACDGAPSPSSDEHHDEHAESGHGHEHADEEVPKGPHGGRLLKDGDFAVELAIFESGVPPEYRAWITQAGQPVDSKTAQLTVDLARLGGVTDHIAFAPYGDFLRGDQEIVEPHSFDMKITAMHAGKTHRWEYASYEGRVQIAADMAEQAGIVTAVAGPGVIEEHLQLYGTIVPDATRVREVQARFPGVIRRVYKQVGERVRAGETLASVESNESLRTYPVLAPIAGVITERHADSGEQTDAEALFEIADFSKVWAEFSVFARDRARLREGLPVQVRADGGHAAAGRIAYISPLSSRPTQTLTARVVLDNTDARWTPGQFVEGQVNIAQTKVALAVPLSALQSFRDFTVVFAQVGETYEVRMLELGRRDGERVEVLSGLTPGTTYVTENSYLIKADIEKSGAAHDH